MRAQAPAGSHGGGRYVRPPKRAYWIADLNAIRALFWGLRLPARLPYRATVPAVNTVGGKTTLQKVNKQVNRIRERLIKPRLELPYKTNIIYGFYKEGVT
jgi:hypothetical protein